ncbi:protein pecanex [Anopheles ziemanni]|uniref:protein pecanex n=1 Tax=Anopheles coustani TaxID=139045 RepID=UPI002658D447|nr:protein pecanex [Anopheles coustani]XP_058168951.1 protein pecanex [Anopheles ziemanni]
MGSQTLEILRQGVLASLTGGWYYDVHQNVFCNAVHLYIWLFLLFLPFIIYMYFPTTVAVWSVYCVLIAIIITFFKTVNVALHRMYDRARTLSETNLKKPGSGSGLVGGGLGGPGGAGKVPHETVEDDDEPGMEMQMLGTGQVGGGGVGGVGGGGGTPPVNVSSRTSVEHQHSDENSYANSAISIDYQEQVTSTIDLKVDVHRKNSSESSDSGLSGGGAAGRHDSIPASAACSDTCFRSNHVAEANSETPYGPIVGSGSIVRCNTVQTHSADVCNTATHKRSLSTPNQERFSELVLETVVREMTREFGDQPKGGGESGRTKDHFPGSTRMVGAQSNASLRRHQYKSKRKQRFMNTQLQRQISLDSEKLGMGADNATGGGAGRGEGTVHGDVSDGTRNRRQRGGSSGGVGHEGGGMQLQRHLSSDDQSNKSIMSLFRNHQLSHHHHHHHHHHHLLALQNREPDLYMDHSYTKSAVQLASADPSGGNESTNGSGKGTTGYLLHQATPPIRRDSSSTMSALQLPTVASSSSSAVAGAIGSSGGGGRNNGSNDGGTGEGVPSSSKRRRHSNTTNTTGAGGATGRPMPRSLTSVRRIKSAALEICCSPASIPNLTPTHPNSVEVIGGQTLRNPRHTVLPPPSKSLSRNPYLNLFTKSNEGSSGSGLVDVCDGADGQPARVDEGVSSGGAGMEPVYPIAEQSDESTPIKSSSGGRMALDDKTPVQRFDLHSDSDEGLEDDEDDEDREEEDEEDEDEEEDDGDEDDEEEDDGAMEAVDVDGGEDALVDQVNSCGDRVEGAAKHKAEAEDDGRKLHGRIADSEEDLTRHDQLRRLHHQQKQIQQQQQQQQEQQRLPASGMAVIALDDPADESDLDAQDAGLQSTDSDTENNAGSRSPLLEPRAHRTNSEQLVGTASAHAGGSIVEAKNGSCCAVVTQKLASEVKKTSSSPTISTTGGGTEGGPHHKLLRSTMKTFDEMTCHSSSDWEQASASSKDLLIVKEQTARDGGGASDAATVGSSESEPQLPGPSGMTKLIGEGAASASTEGTVSLGQRSSLGAIPKTTTPPSGGMYMGARRLSVEDNYPNASSKAYNRTLSQRLSAERIPENSTAAPLITFLNYRSDVAIPPIYLPGNSALSEQQTANGFTFRRPVPLPATRPYRQLNCRLRMLKPSDGVDNGGGGGASGSSTGAVATPGADFWRDDDNNNNHNNNNNSSYYLETLESQHQQARLQSIAAMANSAAGGNGTGNGNARVLCNELMSGSVGEVPMNFYVTGDSDRWLHCAANVIKERFSTLNHHLHAHSHMHHHHHHRTISISGPSTSGGTGVGGVGGVGSGLASTSASGGGATVGMMSSTVDDFNSASINSGSGIVDKALVASTDCSLSRGQSTIDVVQYGETTTGGGGVSAAKVVRPKRYYRFPLKFLCFREHLNISMNRLQLLALFDRDTSWAQVVLAIALCTLVSLLGSLVLYLKFYEDLYAFIFCFVIAGSQYSLLKSVQPDAASPIHGFNKTVTYSRPVYFCLCCALLLIVHRLLREYELELGIAGGARAPLSIVLFGFPISIITFLQSAQSVLSVVILAFPFLFSLGLFPQINTFTMYALEQIDMHLFGSNASCSLLASFLSVVRSIVACTLLYGLVYGALSETGTQHVLFSMYCACLVTVAYHLSRCTSDFTYFWAVIKSNLLTHSDYDSDASSKADSKLSSDSCDDGKDEGGAGAGVGGELRRSSAGAESSTARSTDEMNRDFDEEAGGRGGGGDGGGSKELDDPLPRKLQDTVTARLKNDAVVCAVLSLATFSLHCSTVFTVLQPEINYVLHTGACLLGFLVHYIVPQLRKHLPWLCIAKPILKPDEFGLFEVQNLSKIMWFETMYVLLCFFERNILYPLIFVSALTADAVLIVDKFGLTLGTLLIVVCSLKCVRNAYSDVGSQYIILIFTVLFFRLDYKMSSETFLFDYFLISILYRKVAEFLLKLQFVVTYIAPWQITWGSAFHAFAQPFSVPHSAMLFLQTAISAVLSTPLNPFLGSAIFLTSYVRPIKFWERDYNTRRIDHSNTRLSSQLERDLGADDNNLNSIFYEHLTRSLQHSLCGDLMMGRWGNVSQGDCFVLASDYLNCLVHIIELGNGLCTFQMRGLEFRGTYCQQREVEAISEEVEDNIGCCCCTIGHLPRMLSANAMFTTRWLAWQVMASKYVLEGYSISDNSATATLQVFEFRKVLISYYVKSIIFYTLRSPKLLRWLTSKAIEEALEHTTDRQFVDLDPVFNNNLDDDYDYRAAGITRASFWCVYGDWIQFCSDKKRQQLHAATHDRGPDKQQQPQQGQGQGNVSAAAGATTNTTTTVAATPSGGGNCMVSSSTSVGAGNKGTAEGQGGRDGVEQKEDKAAGSGDGGWMGADGGKADVDCGESSGTNGNGGMAGGPSSNGAEATPGSSQTNGASASTTTATNGSSNNTQQFFVSNRDSLVTSLCMSLALLARRTLATASHSASCNVEFFLHGLHALFKGDFRITCPRDEWVFADMELLHGVVAPAVRMSLKLHQDHFLCPDEYDDYSNLYNAIDFHTKELVISHEADPLWRNAVLRGTPHLLALRHVMDDGSDEYRVIRLSKRFLNFRVIKLNRECVRGLWAGQQQELIYLRNRNPERGSIQNAKQALRNIINSSCDQPIGYPIYVSPLTTSYAETNAQLCRIVGGEITLEKIQQMLIRSWQRIRQRCREGCSSGSATIIDGEMTEMQGVYCNTPTPNNTLSGTAGTLSYGSQNMSISGAVAARGSMASINKPTSTTLLAGFLNRERDAEREAMAAMGGAGVRERSMIAKRNLGSTSKDRLEWTALQLNKRDSFREVLSEAVGSASGGVAGGSGNESSAGADDESQSTAGGGSPSTTMPRKQRLFIESFSGVEGFKVRYIDDTSGGPGTASGSGAAAAGSRIPGVPGTLMFTLSPPEQSSTVDLFGKTPAVASANPYRHWKLRPPPIGLNRKVIIVDASQICDSLDLGRRIDVIWPNEEFRASGGRQSWKDWCPQEGMVGLVVHYWQPNHPDHHFRSNVNHTILLVEIGTRHVPIGEKGVKEYNTAGLQTLVSSSSTVPIDDPLLSADVDESTSGADKVTTPISASGERTIVPCATSATNTTAINSDCVTEPDVPEVTSSTVPPVTETETETKCEPEKEQLATPASEDRGESEIADEAAATASTN